MIKGIITHVLRSWRPGRFPPESDNILNRTLRILRLQNLFCYFMNNHLSFKRQSWLFNTLVNKFKIEVTLVPSKALEQLYKKSILTLTKKSGAKRLGDYLEFGVYQGDSLLCMCRSLKDMGIESVRLFGFDSFEGLPEVNNADDATNRIWAPGDFRADYDYVKKRLTKRGINWNRTTLIKGFFKETLKKNIISKYKIKKASIIMIDCDYYISAKQALEFCAPLIQDEAIILFDDWNSTEGNSGEKRAFAEFLKENSHFTAKKFGSYSSTAKVFLVSRINLVGKKCMD